MPAQSTPQLDDRTILVLDDNPLVLKLVRAMLERDGAIVVTAASWIEFNHVLEANAPDAILLDVNLPSIKGNRLSEVLKSQPGKRDIPIILISDLPEATLDEILPGSGADSWLRKPLTRDKLINEIKRLLPS
ncbi:MAG: response regulator [Acidobacteriota bacterium]